MVRNDYAHLFSEDGGATFRQVGITDDTGRARGMAEPTSNPRYVNAYKPYCMYAVGCDRWATTTLDIPPIGEINACQPCADLYHRLGK